MENFNAEKMEWLKSLVDSEQQMEESGIVDMQAGFDPDKLLVNETIQFLLQIKTEFVEASSVFNELKVSAIGRVKIYGIAKTHADFMLFRNGFKMIFSMKAPGQISIRFNFIGNNFITQSTTQTELGVQNSTIMDEQLLEAKWGPFGEIFWTYETHPFQLKYMVRYYMSHFLKESAK